MITYPVRHWPSGKVLYGAEIDCGESVMHSKKLRLAVEWCRKNNASLAEADLRGANLSEMSLPGVTLTRANLSGANMSCAILPCPDMRGAKMYRANLMDAKITDADMRDVDMRGASLTNATMTNTEMGGAKVKGAFLWGVTGLNEYIKCIQVDRYPIAYTSVVIQIGCERHTHERWRNFSDDEIDEMDGASAVEWWRKWKDWIFQTIEMAPAKSMNREGKT